MKFSEWVKPDTVAVLCTAVYVGVPSQGHERCYTFINGCASVEQVTRDEPDIEIKRCIECGKPLISRQ